MAKEMAKGTHVAGREYGPGKAVGEDSLSGAVRELNSQHPEKAMDRGPHHSGPKPNGVSRHTAVS